MMAYQGRLLTAILLMITSLCHPSLQDTILFVTTGGDGDRNPPGLYGALVTDDRGKITIDPHYNFHIGYHCLNTNGNVKQGFDLKSVAYDTMTGQVLLQKEEDDNKLITLYTADVCYDGSCKYQNLYSLFYRFRIVRDTPKTFASYNGEIYFLSEQKRGVETNVLNVIQLRKFVGCNDLFPVRPSTGFDMDTCSEVLANLADELAPHASYSPLSGLEIVEIGDEKFAFLTMKQILYQDVEMGEYNNVAVNLYVVNIKNNGGYPILLHSEKIGRQYQSFIIKHIGSLDFEEGKICWSAVDRILCADFSSRMERLERVRYIVQPGAASGTVCFGDGIYSNITTGVAFGSYIHDEISLFFGCMSTVLGTGGAGFVRMRHFEYEITPRLHSFRNISSPLFAGQMFVSHKCAYRRDDDYENTAVMREGEIQGDEVRYVYSAQGSSTKAQLGPCALLFVFLRVFLIGG